MLIKNPSSPFYERFAYVFTGLAVFGFLVVAGKDMLDPLMFGFLFAILLLPAAVFLEKKVRLPRSLSSLISILLLLAFVSCILYLVGSQISHLVSDWPMLQSQIGQSLNDLSYHVQATFHIDASKQMSYLHDTSKKIVENGTGVIGHTFNAVSSLMLFYALIFVFTFFILLYRSLLIRFIVRVFSDEYSAVVYDIAENIQRILRQYILGLLTEMLVVASLACTAFWIIGIKYAVLLGLITGLFNLIPYLGILTALLLSTLITFATGSIKDSVYVAVSVAGIHAVDANLLLPTIVGSKVKLNALVTFLGIILGEMIWGLSGMFLSIPTLAILKIIFDRVESLKPWGFLLGSGMPAKKSLFKKRNPTVANKT